jgi:hypothetical protein
MHWYERLALRLAQRRLLKEIAKMKPLPKWAGVLSWLVANAGTIYVGYTQGGVKGAVIALIGLLTTTGTLVSHSLTGTGGATPSP